jgi:hypothetical protein
MLNARDSLVPFEGIRAPSVDMRANALGEFVVFVKTTFSSFLLRFTHPEAHNATI